MSNYSPSITRPPVLEVNNMAGSFKKTLLPGEQCNVLSFNNIVCDSISLNFWNTDHSGENALKELWFDKNNDTCAVMSDGKIANYVQGDYPISAIELYHYESEADKPANIEEVYSKCKRVAILDEVDKHYDVSGLKWNVSVYYFTRGR